MTEYGRTKAKVFEVVISNVLETIVERAALCPAIRALSRVNPGIAQGLVISPLLYQPFYLSSSLPLIPLLIYLSLSTENL